MDTRTCSVCFAEIPVSTTQTQHDENETEVAGEDGHGPGHNLQSFPPNGALPECSKSHNLDTCYSCLDNYIRCQMDVCGPAACNAIECTEPTCHHIYTFDEIKKITTPATFSRYDEILTRKVLREIPNFRWCLGTGCGSGAIYYAKDPWEDMGCRGQIFLPEPLLTEPGRLITCPDCKFTMCFTHQVPCFKQIRSCLERYRDPYLTLSAQGCAQCRQEILDRGSEDSSEAWIAKNTKRCPRLSCRVPIEKQEGCPHIICATCGYEFCWDCLGPYDHAHLADQCRENPAPRNVGANGNSQSRATEPRTPNEIYNEALVGSWEAIGERRRILDELGITVSQTAVILDELPLTQPQPRQNVLHEHDQQQRQGLLTTEQLDFLQREEARRVRHMDWMAQKERDRQHTTTDRAAPRPNTDIRSLYGHRHVAASNIPRSAFNVIPATYNPGVTYNQHNRSFYHQPRPSPFQPVPNPAVLSPFAGVAPSPAPPPPFGVYHGPQAGRGYPVSGNNWYNGHNRHNRPNSHNGHNRMYYNGTGPLSLQQSPYPVYPMGNHHASNSLHQPSRVSGTSEWLSPAHQSTRTGNPTNPQLGQPPGNLANRARRSSSRGRGQHGNGQSRGAS